MFGKKKKAKTDQEIELKVQENSSEHSNEEREIELKVQENSSEHSNEESDQLQVEEQESNHKLNSCDDLVEDDFAPTESVDVESQDSNQDLSELDPSQENADSDLNLQDAQVYEPSSAEEASRATEEDSAQAPSSVENSELTPTSEDNPDKDSTSDLSSAENSSREETSNEDLAIQDPAESNVAETASPVDACEPTQPADPATEAASAPVSHKSKHKKELTPRERKSRRVRRILIVVIILLLAACAALPYLVITHLQENQTQAVQQVLNDASTTPDKAETKDASTAITKKTDVPKLMELIGKTKEEAVAFLGHGAFVSAESEVKEPGNPIVLQATVPLTEEPADVRSGTPTVYLGLDKENRVLQAGYSVATASLGYAPSSFVDAVKNEGIIDKTLAEAGLKVAPDTVKLPNDRMVYTHMTPDNKTIAEEKCNFEGDADSSGARYHWSAVLSYNYTAANASGNLADTIRQVSIFIKKI